MKKACIAILFVAVFSTALVLPERAGAVTKQWTGGTSNNWNETLGSGVNWTPAGVPGASDLVLFSTGSGSAANLATNNDVPGGASILGISNTLAPAGDISISGNPLTIGSSGIVFALSPNSATKNLAINTDITLSAPQIWSIGGTGSSIKLTIGASSANTVDLNGNALTLKWNTVAGQTMDLKSTISGASAVNLLRIGNGKSQIRFNANNTYSGGTNIDQGGEVVQLGSNTALSGPTVVSGPLGTGLITFTNNTTGGNSPFVEAYGADRVIDNNIAMTFSGGTAGNSFGVITSPGETNHKLTINGTITSLLGNKTITTDAATATGSGDLVLNGNLIFGTSGQPGGTFTLGQSGGAAVAQGGKIFVNGSILETAGVSTGIQLTVPNGSPAFPTRVQLSGQNTYSGGTNFGAGSGILSLGSSSVLSGPTIVSGPLGTGTLTFNNGGNTPRIEAVGNQTVANNITFATTSSGIIQGSDNLTLTGVISGGTSPGGNITKNGTGTLTLTRANTYVGSTTVNGGTLLANNTTGSATGPGGVGVNVTVNGAGANGAGGTLGGSGSVAGAVVINGSTTGAAGVLSPGNSIESLGVGSVQFNAPAPGAGAVGSILKFEIGPGGTADLVNGMGGALNISSTSLTVGSTLALVDLGAGIIPSNTKYTVISYNGTWNSNSFVNAPNLGYVSMGPNVFQIRYQDTTPGGNYTDETSLNTTGRFVTLTAVPEFGSFLTMGLVGFCALGAVRLGKRYGFKALSL